jgi:hypothetical protein
MEGQFARPFLGSALHRHPLSAGQSDDLRWVLVSRRSPLPAQVSILEDLCQWALLRFEGGGDARRWPTRHGFRVGPAAAQSTTRSFYNERGSFAGSSVTRGNSSSFYDWQGRFSGSAIRHGNSTSFYDGRGRYSSINTSPRR